MVLAPSHHPRSRCRAGLAAQRFFSWESTSMSDFEPAQAFGETSIRLTRPESEESDTAIAGHSNWGSTLRRQLPYILVLGLAIVGVAYTNMAHQPLVGYWEFLALATGVVCVVAEWPKLHDGQAHL